MLFPESFRPVSLNIVDSPTSFFALHHSPRNATLAEAKEKKVLLLLHGFPQNHTLWHAFIEELDKRGILDEWHIVIPDLPGYGQSTKPASPDGSHAAHSKRAIAADCVSLIDTIFSKDQEFFVVGHDRGSRVSYRLAADCKRVRGVCLMEIIPTRLMFETMTSKDKHVETLRKYHWIFLALPPPLPETLISASSDFFFRHCIESWTGPKFKSSDNHGEVTLKYDPVALDSWIKQYHNPLVLQGALEDYRAGATLDLDHDAEPKPLVDCPVLILCGGEFSRRYDVESIWKAERVNASTLVVKHVGDENTGHFIPIEAAADCALEISEWLTHF